MLILRIIYGIIALLVVVLIILAHQIKGIDLTFFYCVLLPLLLLRGVRSFLLSDMIVKGGKKLNK